MLDVDRCGRGCPDPAGQSLLVDGFDREREEDVLRCGDVLARPAVVLGEDGAQGGVPGDDVPEGQAQCLCVERSVDAQGEGDVVGGRGPFETVEEPQALLGVGQRECGGAFLRDEGGAGGPVRVPQGGGERGDGGVLEEGADLRLGVQGGADAADEAGGEQGVAAQGEEVVVDTDPVHPQYIGEQPGEDLLVGGARRAPAGAGQGGGGGQGRPVELAVGGQRKRVERLDDRRHHVGGQLTSDVGGEQLRVRGTSGAGTT